MTRTFAIGDIHGCYNELMAMMSKLEKEAKLNYDKDIVVFMGDYIDRGPDSQKVIEQLILWSKKYKHWKFLMGNHEHMLIEEYIRKSPVYPKDIWLYNGGYETLTSYRKQWDLGIGLIPVEHVDFMYALDLNYEDEKYFYAHAGVTPELTLEENKELPPESILWIRGDFLNSGHDWGKKIIAGHTPNRYDLGQPMISDNKIVIDGAVCPPGNKNLIAVELPSEKIYLQPSLTK